MKKIKKIKTCGTSTTVAQINRSLCKAVRDNETGKKMKKANVKRSSSYYYYQRFGKSSRNNNAFKK